MQIGEAIARARGRSRFRTQSELAAAAGINQTSLSRYESGGSVPDDKRELIEEALGMKRGELLIEAGLIDPDLIEGRDVGALLDVSDLPYNERELVLGFIEMLRDNLKQRGG